MNTAFINEYTETDHIVMIKFSYRDSTVPCNILSGGLRTKSV